MTTEDRGSGLPLIARHAEKETLPYNFFFMYLFSMGGFGFLWWFEWIVPGQAWYINLGAWFAGMFLSVLAYLYMLNAEYFDWLDHHQND